MKRAIIPHVISGEQPLCTLPPDSTVSEAAGLMTERKIGAVMIVERGKLLGIVTERDMVTKVIARDINAKTTSLNEIMTRDPETISPDDTAGKALELMRSGRYRHLPVLNGGELCGMVSIRDLYEAVSSGLKEDFEQAQSFIYGSDQYGVAS